VNLPDDFGGRIEARGNTFGTIRTGGDFAGALSTPGGVNNLIMSAGAFTGSIRAGDDLNSATLNNVTFGEAGLLATGGRLSNLQFNGGSFSGTIQAAEAGNLNFQTGSNATASLSVDGSVGAATFAGIYGGEIDLGAANRLTFNRALTETGSLSVEDSVQTLQLLSGTADGGRAVVSGGVGGLFVGGTHEGVISIEQGLSTGTLANVTEGLLSVGLDTHSLTVTGASDGAVYSIGTFVGEDGLYNTADDRITGGSLVNSTFLGEFRDSALLAGVLPRQGVQTLEGSANRLPASNLAYVGNPFATSVLDQDSAEAGGPVSSEIRRATFQGQIVNTDVGAGRRSVVAAADAIETISSVFGTENLATRVYDDPAGAPTLLSTVSGNEREVQLIFSEPINSASFTLARDANDDGDFDDPADTPGSVELTDVITGESLDSNITLNYTTVLSGGAELGVLRLINTAGNFNSVQIRLNGDPLASAETFLTNPAVIDRSGLRSVLRDPDQDGRTGFGATAEDKLGTILDGDGDGNEGGDVTTFLAFGDLPDNFEEVGGASAVATDGDPFTLVEGLDSTEDVDVLRIDANAGEFLSYALSDSESLVSALFFRDDQGTVTTSDDTFEQVARSERKSEDTTDDDEIDNFQAVELLETGEYYLVTGFDPFAGALSTDDESYEIEVRLASTPTGLGAIPAGEEIGFIDNSENTPTQLVYVNFTGGVAEQLEADLIPDGQTAIEAFDATVLDARFTSGDTQRLIEGDAAVTGIMDQIQTIYSTTSPADPDGQLNVQRLTQTDFAGISNIDAFNNAFGEGLFLTTVDPRTVGIAEDNFTELLIGPTEEPGFPGLFGLASQVDFVNLEKGDEAVILADSFAGVSNASGKVDALDEFSLAFGSVIAHELGHTLGLNHTRGPLLPDDPDNNPGTNNDPVLDFNNSPPTVRDFVNLMVSGAEDGAIDTLTTGLWRLGTSEIFTGSTFGTAEFPIGDVDNVDQLLNWLS